MADIGSRTAVHDEEPNWIGTVTVPILVQVPADASSRQSVSFVVATASASTSPPVDTATVAVPGGGDGRDCQPPPGPVSASSCQGPVRPGDEHDEPTPGFHAGRGDAITDPDRERHRARPVPTVGARQRDDGSSRTCCAGPRGHSSRRSRRPVAAPSSRPAPRGSRAEARSGAMCRRHSRRCPRRSKTNMSHPPPTPPIGVKSNGSQLPDTAGPTRHRRSDRISADELRPVRDRCPTLVSTSPPRSRTRATEPAPADKRRGRREPPPNRRGEARAPTSFPGRCSRRGVRSRDPGSARTRPVTPWPRRCVRGRADDKATVVSDPGGSRQCPRRGGRSNGRRAARTFRAGR